MSHLTLLQRWGFSIFDLRIDDELIDSVAVRVRSAAPALAFSSVLIVPDMPAVESAAVATAVGESSGQRMRRAQLVSAAITELAASATAAAAAMFDADAAAAVRVR